MKNTSSHFDHEGKVWFIDKPYQWTSFDVVKRIRRVTGEKKVGHAGTLDPLATGLLIVCSGKKTKTINDYMSLPKKYSGQIFLGAKTKSYDLETTPRDFRPIQDIDLEKIQGHVQSFVGEIEQSPPIFSAIKVKGKRSYSLARKGEEVTLKKRKILVQSFDIVQWLPPILFFTLECSTGTYVRSIASDLGNLLNCGAYLYSLRRSQIGNYDVEHAQRIKDIKSQTGY